MPTYRKQKISGQSAPDVSIGGVKGGVYAKQQRFHSVFRGVDKCLSMGRRVIVSVGANGETEFSADASDSDVDRIIGMGRSDLSPGSMLALSVMHLPSGDTGNGPSGEIRLEITWSDPEGNDVNSDHTLVLSNGSAMLTDPWQGIRVRGLSTITPEPLSNVADLWQWSRHTHVKVEVHAVGNPRLLDVVVYEVPLEIALEESDDNDQWTSTFMHQLSISDSAPNLLYPVQQINESSNRTGGTFALMDACNAQAYRLGAQLFSWSDWDPSDYTGSGSGGGVGDFGISDSDTTNWYRVGDGATSTDPLDLVATNDFGWGAESGAYSRPARLNPDASMENTGVIPVRLFIRIYNGGLEAARKDFRFRLYSDEGSYIEIDDEAPSSDDAPSTDEGWREAFGYLRCGAGPGDPEKFTAVLKSDEGSTFGTLYLYDVVAYRAELYGSLASYTRT